MATIEFTHMNHEWDDEEIQSGSMKWSLLTDKDRETLKWAVESVLPSEPVRFLEIGTYNGSTAWGVKTIVEQHGNTIDYWGIDTQRHDAPMWPEAKMVIGESCKVFHELPDGFDILFIDGPHNSSNCMLDFLHYAPKVHVDGLVLFHDSSPSSQSRLPFSARKIAEYEAGGFEIPTHEEFGTAVLIALEKLGLSTGARTDFELVSNRWTEDTYGGISIYRKLR